MRHRQGFVEISLGNPLIERAYVQINLQFKLVAGRSAGLSKPLEFLAMANTSSAETDLSNNECALKVKVIKQANLELIGG